MLTKQKFFEEVAGRIRESLPPEYEDAEITLSSQVKNNDVELTGLIC